MPPGPLNGTHKPGLHPAAYPMPRVPIPPYHGAPPQPYAIPARGAVHGPVGAVPQLGSRGFGAGRGNTGAPIGGHLPQQQGTQQPIGSVGSNYNYSALESPSSQPSPGGPLSQPGYVSNASALFCCHDSHIFVSVELSPHIPTLFLPNLFLLLNRRAFNQTSHFEMGSLLVACLR